MGTAAPPDTRATAAARIQCIDVVRGIAMILTEIDHVRVFGAVGPSRVRFGSVIPMDDRETTR